MAVTGDLKVIEWACSRTHNSLLPCSPVTMSEVGLVGACGSYGGPKGL